MMMMMMMMINFGDIEGVPK